MKENKKDKKVVQSKRKTTFADSKKTSPKVEGVAKPKIKPADNASNQKNPNAKTKGVNDQFKAAQKNKEQQLKKEELKKPEFTKKKK